LSIDIRLDELAEVLEPSAVQKDLFGPGHNACPGCGSTPAVRMVMRVIGERAIYLVPASCASLYVAPSDTITPAAPVIHTVFAGAFAQAEGLSYALRRRGRDELVVVWAGDGACYDIGLGGLSGIAARGADVLVFCNDNEGYQNTGGHQSSATPPSATTPSGRPTAEDAPAIQQRKDLVEIIAAHRVPYIATACPAFPEDLEAKVRKAKNIRGFRMILVLTTCVTWGVEARHSMKVARLAVDTGYFPLYEVENGIRYRITYEPPMRPVEEFAALQKRFRNNNLDSLKREIQMKWEDLRFKASRFR
jgi:pyruvate ferredoxin oxidoreductase beta subunit/2-oxoisovalerate ferredoxin oxidoreductase beta subunit